MTDTQIIDIRKSLSFDTSGKAWGDSIAFARAIMAALAAPITDTNQPPVNTTPSAPL